jgi:chromosome segregation ATPase
MELIADMLMIAATIGAAIYCLVLAARLRRFTTLETGMGGAIAVLSAQVDDMTRALEKAKSVATTSEQNLQELTARAEALARRLELLMASLHDLPEPAVKPPRPEPEPEEDQRRLRFVRRRVGRDYEEELP